MLYPPMLLFHPLELHKVNLFLLPHKSSQSPLKFFSSSASPVVSVLAVPIPFSPLLLLVCLPERGSQNQKPDSQGTCSVLERVVRQES